MENFVYETPTKVYFGKEEELNVGKIIAGYAPKKVLVHFGGQSARKSGLLDRVEKALEAEGIAYVGTWRCDSKSGAEAGAGRYRTLPAGRR